MIGFNLTMWYLFPGYKFGAQHAVLCDCTGRDTSRNGPSLRQSNCHNSRSFITSHSGQSTTLIFSWSRNRSASRQVSLAWGSGIVILLSTYHEIIFSHKLTFSLLNILSPAYPLYWLVSEVVCHCGSSREEIEIELLHNNFCMKIIQGCLWIQLSLFVACRVQGV
jgi:hypothetical protein